MVYGYWGLIRMYIDLDIYICVCMYVIIYIIIKIIIIHRIHRKTLATAKTLANF